MKFKIFRFKKVLSTNDTAIRIINNSNCNYGMVISNNQKKGRGQYGKKWISYEGNLFVSFFYRMNESNISLKQLTKNNCLLVKKLLSNYFEKKIIFKRPNDLLIDKRKISGILQEIIEKSDIKYLIVGIGINLKRNPNIANYPTINLSHLSKKRISKTKIEKELKKIFEDSLNKIIYKKK